MKEEKITITNAQELRQEKCNVPTLRFSNKTIWEKKRIKDFCEVNPKTEELEDEFIYIDLESVSKGCLLSKNIISKTNAPSRAQRVLKNNDILFQCVRPYQMNNLLFNAENADFQYVASTGYAQIRTQENSSFVYQLLHSSKFNKEVMLRCTGSSYPAISSSDLEDIEVYICGVEEQQKIGYFLDLIDRRIAVQNKIISDLKVLKKELCRKMLSSITEYKTLGELCSITTGKLDANANNQNGLYPFFTCGKDTLSINNYAFDGEAILIAGNGDIGHTKYYYGKFNAYQRTYVLMGFKADAQFVKMGIDTYLPQKISEEMQGGAMPYIKLSTLTSLKIPFTTEEKQLSIRNHYDTIAQKVENETKILDLLLQQKSYFLNAMFI